MGKKNSYSISYTVLKEKYIKSMVSQSENSLISMK